MAHAAPDPDYVWEFRGSCLDDAINIVAGDFAGSLPYTKWGGMSCGLDGLELDGVDDYLSGEVRAATTEDTQHSDNKITPLTSTHAKQPFHFGGDGEGGALLMAMWFKRGASTATPIFKRVIRLHW